MVDPSTSAPLDYAPAPPRRWKWVRRSVGVVVLLAMVAAGWRWSPRAWTQLQILYWQRQCMNYTAPPDRVVYEEEPGAIARLAATPGYLTGQRTYRGGRGPPRPSFPYAYQVTPAPLTQLLMSNPLSCRPGVVMFLHERTSPSGNRRLVYVSYFHGVQQRLSPPTWAIGVEIDAAVLIPEGLTTTATDVPRTLSRGVANTPKVQPLVRVFAGQPDPNDRSHFTIRYQMWGQEDVLDGWLGDDDRVTLKPRKLPTPPGPP